MYQAGCVHLCTVSDMIHPCLSACPNKSGEGLILVDFLHSDFWWISHTQILEDFSSSVEMPHHSVCPSGWPAASSETRHHISLLQICYHGRISSTKIRCSICFQNMIQIWKTGSEWITRSYHKDFLVFWPKLWRSLKFLVPAQGKTAQKQSKMYHFSKSVQNLHIQKWKMHKKCVFHRFGGIFLLLFFRT